MLPLAALVALCVMFGSSAPAPAPGHRLTFLEHLGPTGLQFSWRNLTCPTCKALFVILDIALLVLVTSAEINLAPLGCLFNLTVVLRAG